MPSCHSTAITGLYCMYFVYVLAVMYSLLCTRCYVFAAAACMYHAVTCTCCRNLHAVTCTCCRNLHAVTCTCRRNLHVAACICSHDLHVAACICSRDLHVTYTLPPASLPWSACCPQYQGTDPVPTGTDTLTPPMSRSVIIIHPSTSIVGMHPLSCM